MNENAEPAPVRMTARLDSHETLDWTAEDVCTEEERSWPAVAARPRVDGMTVLEPAAGPVLVLTLTPARPMAETDRTTLAGDLKLLRYALDEYDRSLGGDGFALAGTAPGADAVTLTLAPLVVEGAGARLAQIVRVLEAEAGPGPDPADETPVSGLTLARPRFGRVQAEVAHPSKA